MKQRRRLAYGLILAPIVPIIGFTVASVLHDGLDHAVAWFPGALIFCPFAYGAELVLALPAHRAMSARGIERLAAYCWLGCGIGASPFIVLALFVLVASRGRSFDHDTVMWLRWSLIGAAYGLVSAVAFWCIAVRPKDK